MNQIIRKKGGMSLIHIILFLLCLAAMNIVNRYYFAIYITFGFYCLKPKRKIYIDPMPLAMLLLLGISWMLFSPTSTASIFGAIKPFTYFFCYVVGFGLLDDDVETLKGKTSYKLFYMTIVAISIGSFLHYVLNWIINNNALNRNTIDIWTKEIMAATGQAALACLPLGIAIACLFVKTNKKIKIISISTILLVLGYNLILSGRTLLVMFLTVVAVSFLHMLSTLKKGKIRLIIIILAAILLLLFIYQANILNFRSFIEKSPIYDRFFAEDSAMELDEDTRLENKIYYLNNFDKYLWGGVHFRNETGYAHDILFDTYDEAGIFALVAIVGYLVVSFTHMVRTVMDKSLSFVFRNMVLCMYVIVYLEFMVEPILQGMPWIFAVFCLIDGYVGRILRYNRSLISKVR